MEPFHTEPPAVPESTSSRVNSQNRSRQVRLETRQGENRLRIADDNWTICSLKNILCKASKNKCMPYYGGQIFSRIFHVPYQWVERLSSGTVHS